jgi:[ribosomal protein S5]-alanine N-acetyltransferase
MNSVYNRMGLKLREWRLDDLESVLVHSDNDLIRRFMSDGFPDNKEKWKRFIEFASENKFILYLAIEIDGFAVGGIGISPQKDYMRKNAELGYWLSESYWGQGIMTKAICEIVKKAFDRFDIDRIYATPFETNLASHRVLEKSGFVLEGRFKKVVIKNGKMLDELVYAIRR